MSEKIKLLDCTLRDGCYIVDSMFGSAAIRGLIEKLDEAGVELIECGWLKNSEHTEGSAFYHVPSDLERYLTRKDPRKTYLVMIDWDRYDLGYLPPCDGKSVDAVRVVFPHGKYKEGIAVGRAIKEKGYKVYFQAANTLAYSDEDLKDLAEEINSAEPECLSIVDTFGAMYEEDLERIAAVLDKHLKSSVALGFHSHNNQQLSFALTQHFVRLLAGSGRTVTVDASLCGMGRGAGNTTTELAVSYLNRKQGCHYDLDAVMDAIDTYMVSFAEKYRWGYNTSYFIAGLYCCHVNNIAYLLDNHRTSARDMRNIIDSMDAADRLKYDYDLLESKYIANQSRIVDDAETCERLRAELLGKRVVLVAPGSSSLERKAEIESYIAGRDCAVIAVNALLEGYAYDYAFFVNPGRYEYASKARPETFGAVKRIVLSNILSEPEDGEYIVRYDNAVRRGWKYFDNAVICCLRLLDFLGVTGVAVAGFDGFRDKYNESYADPTLPSLNAGGDWAALNEDIKAMFTAFRREARCLREVEFLTESYFNDREDMRI
ncbi:MAG: aldolase catalytic domain-containing protein [Ruminococcus sp.]|nr:aldolase catalytic domain-containing protein [Ruminococcus sp.]